MTIAVQITHTELESDRALEVRAVDPVEGSIQDSRVLLPGDVVVMHVHRGCHLVAEETEL